MIYEKRGRWCAVSDTKRLRKFNTEAEAMEYLGIEEDTEELNEPSEAQEWESFDPDC